MSSATWHRELAQEIFVECFNGDYLVRAGHTAYILIGQKGSSALESAPPLFLVQSKSLINVRCLGGEDVASWNPSLLCDFKQIS